MASACPTKNECDSSGVGASMPSNLNILSQFYHELLKADKEWTMKCRICAFKVKSQPGVTSNFHRHLRVCVSRYF
jgi:hypothetical protein